MSSALATLDGKLNRDAAPAVDRPIRATFEEFLLKDARVPISGGEYGPYTFEGREAIRGIVRRIDAILGSEAIAKIVASGRQPTAEEVIELSLPDSLLGVAGGAQWGKTILELNLAAYLTSQRFLNCGMFLPSDDLVQGIVDTKFRPDVLDQISWFAEMTQVGKAVNASGKSANRKGAFLVTDGIRRANGMVLGLQKIPTTFTFDVTLQDEVDDIPEKNAKYVKGRRTSSDIRFDVRIGTQRVNGRGQNKVWKDGSQGVVILGPAAYDFEHLLQTEASKRQSESARELGETSSSAAAQDLSPAALPRLTHATALRRALEAGDEVLTLPDDWLNPEEAFPGIIRCQIGARPSIFDPTLTWAGDFRHDVAPDQTVAVHKPTNRYYLAHPLTGQVLNRRHPLWLHRAPEKFEARNFTYRAAQLGFNAIGLSQIVSQFQLAVADPEEMIVFRCDVLALPQSTAQAITPAVLDRSKLVEPFEMRMRAENGRAVYGGIDVGDRCYFTAREIESRSRKRMIYAATITAGDLVSRATALFHQIGLSALFIDQRPLVSQSRSLALELNGLNALTFWPTAPSESNTDAHISLPDGLTWEGSNRKWTGLRCAVVRFDKNKIGAGIEHGFDIFEEGGVTKWVPMIRCNRFETIDRVVRELLTPAESIVEVVDGAVRETPSMLLPSSTLPIVNTVCEHIVTGSERAKEKDGTLGDYVDGCANHFLFANGYAALAETIGAALRQSQAFELDVLDEEEHEERRAL